MRLIKRVLSIAVTLFLLLSAAQFGQINVRAESTTSVEVGDYIYLGHYNGQAILWRCAGKDQNGKMMITDSVLCNKSFDA